MLLIQQLTGGQVLVLLLMNSAQYLSNICHSKATVISNHISDNIFTLQQWCSTTFPQAKEQLEHMYREVGSVSLLAN
jgi:hypothetical protein